METFVVTFNPEQKEGVFGVSLVENPAIEVDFVALSKEEESLIQLQTIDEDKQILVGAVLIPNKVIPRITPEGVPYNIVFPKETIALAQEYFFKRNNQHNSTIEHDLFQFIDGFTIIESWIKEDTAMDKSNLYGFNAPVGTWFAMAKVDNPEVWQKVKSGEVKGFSIDAYFDMEPLNQNYMLSEIKKMIEDALDAVKLSSQNPATEPTEPTEPVEPTEPTEPVEPTEPTQLSKEQLLQLAETPTLENLAVMVKVLFEDRFSWKIQEEVLKDTTEDAIKEYMKVFAVEMAKVVDNVKTELSTQIEALKSTEPTKKPTQLTKAKPEVQTDEPKDFRSKILSKLKNS
jgi:hypothetical protein